MHDLREGVMNSDLDTFFTDLLECMILYEISTIASDELHEIAPRLKFENVFQIV